MLLAVDPGADAGWAVFDAAGRLTAAGLAGSPTGGALREGVTAAVIERPMIYPGGRQQARPRDVITLAVRAGEWGGTIRAFLGIEPSYVEPSEWKGQVPKDISHARIFAKLTDAEKNVLDIAGRGVAPSKRHNIIDAVGIGLWKVKR